MLFVLTYMQRHTSMIIFVVIGNEGTTGIMQEAVNLCK